MCQLTPHFPKHFYAFHPNEVSSLFSTLYSQNSWSNAQVSDTIIRAGVCILPLVPRPSFIVIQLFFISIHINDADYDTAKIAINRDPSWKCI